LTFDFDLWPSDQGYNILFFYLAFHGYYHGYGQAVQDLSPWFINMKYLIFDFYLWSWSQGHKILFFSRSIWLSYGVIFCKVGQAVQDLSPNQIFNLWFWPLTLGSRSWKKFFGPNLNKDKRSMRKMYPTKTTRTTTTSTELTPIVDCNSFIVVYAYTELDTTI